MSLPKHLDEAAERLERARFGIKNAPAQVPTVATVQEWLVALTDYCQALSDIQLLNNESIHEKLHALAGRLGLEGVL
jgi:hypothetical protein